MSFTESMLSQKPALEVLGPTNFKMVTAAGILSLTTSSSKKGMDYDCILEPGEECLTKRAKAKQPIWESHKVWDKLAEKWSLDPEIWQSFRLACKKAFIEQQEETAEKQEAEDEKDSEQMKKVKERALDIMQHGDPIKFMVDTVARGNLGNEGMARVIFCCKGAQRVKNSRGLHPKLTGESGMGKSDLVEHCLHVMDKSCYIKGSASPKALFYHPIPDGLIVFMDDYKPDEDLDTIVKQTSSNFHEPYTHLTVSDQQAMQLQTPAEIVWCITSVDNQQDIQVLNRQFSCGVNESKDLTGKVIRKIFHDPVTALPRFLLDEDVLVCREMSRILQAQKFSVAVPYGDDIEWNDLSSRRNPSIFLDLILAHAAWKFMQRERDEHGNVVATVQDFLDAKDLYSSRAAAMMDKLTDKQRELANLIIGNGGQLYKDEAAKLMGVSAERIRKLAIGDKKNNGSYEGGLIQLLPGFSWERVPVGVEVNGISTQTNKILMALTVVENGWAQYADVVTLKNQDQWALQPHCNPTTTQITTPDIDSSNSTATITTPIEKERDEHSSTPSHNGLNEGDKKNEILSQCQNEGCNRCSGPTDPDCRGCSGPNSGVKDRVAVPEDADSEGLQCSKEIVL